MRHQRLWLSWQSRYFNPRTPCGVRLGLLAFKRVFAKFQSTHPLRGATLPAAHAGAAFLISIHAPLAGCDLAGFQESIRKKISIHAPLAGCDERPGEGLDGRRYFNPRTPCGVRLQICGCLNSIFWISIHAPLAGCDSASGAKTQMPTNFNPRTPCGVRPEKAATEKAAAEFQSTHPLRGATGTVLGDTQTDYISIHAPLAGCDPVGGIADASHGISIHAPLAGCDQEICCKALGKDGISIHAPLAGCDDHRVLFRHAVPISIHAPLAGCDLAVSRSSRRAANFNPRTPCGVRPESGNRRRQWEEFQSTHPLRGATRKRHDLHRKSEISIHAPLAGCDRCWRRSRRRSSHFNPRTPCGVRRNRHTGGLTWTRFQSTHPLRGATDHRVLFRHAVPISIHAPLAGCDPDLRASHSHKAHFNPRTPCGVRPLFLTVSNSTLLHFNPRTPCGVRQRPGEGLDGR